MAVTASPAPAAPAGVRGQSAPTWVLVTYLAGLVLIYIGERVLSGLPRGASLVTILGLLATAGATILRFSPRFRSGGERRSIETLLAALSVVGLAGVLIYFATSDFGATRLGLDRLSTETRTKFDELSRVLWVSLVGISVVPMVFAETALRPMHNAERPESRRVRSAATAGLILTLAAVYCCFLVYAAYGTNAKIDYSYFKTSKPSESTRGLVKSLSGDPVRVVAFFPQVNEVGREVEGYLRELASGASKLKIEVKDRLLVPKLAQELKAMQDGVIVLSRGSATQSLSLGTDLEQARSKLKTLDRDFQEQLMKIARPRQTAYLTVGHGEINEGRARGEGVERSAQIVRTLLQRQNYQLKDLGLAQGLANDVPEDADVVLLLGPTAPFVPEELAALKRYVDRGGHLFLALEPEANVAQDLAKLPGPDGNEAAPAPSTSAGAPPAASAQAKTAPSAQATPPSSSSSALNQDLARIVSLNYSSDLLANDRQHIPVRYNPSDRTRLMTNGFSSHASVSTLSRNAPRAAVVMFGSGSLDKAPGTSDRIDFTVRSMSGTYQDQNQNFTQDQPMEKASVFNMAAAVTRPLGPAPAKPEEKKDAKKDPKKTADTKSEGPRELRAFVLADSDALSDYVMGQVPGNQYLFLDAVRWLVGEQSVQGLPNTEEDVKIEHTKQGDLGWFYTTIFGAPSLVLGVGLLLSRRSRSHGGKR